MQQHNETLAENQNNSKKDESEKVDINLYFGIFFDGTGANKFQMMLGKKFRRDKLFETYKTQLQAADADINNGHDILKHDRKYWEDKNIFTVSELDQLYFDRDTEGRIEKRIIENCSANDDNNTSIGIASMPNNDDTTKLLKKVATEVAYEEQEDSSDYASSLKDTPAEDSTYTNVAILESCYQYKKKNNEYYIPIYVEGSGSDMQFAKKISAHTFGHILEGFAKATGYAGVTAKVTKMVKMINREIINKGCNKKVKIVFDVFGFSRGATEARIFTYIATESCKSKETLEKLCGSSKPFQNSDVTIIGKPSVRFLGIYDTVSSIGAIRNLNLLLYSLIGNILPTLGETFEDVVTYSSPCDPEVRFTHPYMTNQQEIIDVNDKDAKGFYFGSLSKYHDQNVYDYGLYAINEATSVFHICALDEFRRNFALVDIQSSIDDSNGLELFIPGCHTDIGGAAGIGREKKKQIDKYTKDEFLFNGGPEIESNIPTWWPSTKLFSHNAVYYPSSYEGLQEIGIINTNRINSDLLDVIMKKGFKLDEILSHVETSITTETDGFIEIQPYVKPGYSNVPLHLMFDRTKFIITDHYPFTEDLPPCYKVTAELDKYYNEITSKVIKKEKTGRFFVDPDQETYRWLRQNYLHLSSNCDEIALFKDVTMMDVALIPTNSAPIITKITRNIKRINPQDNYTTNGPSYFEDIYDSSKGDGISTTGVCPPHPSFIATPEPQLTVQEAPQATIKSMAPELHFEAVKEKSAFVSRIIYSGVKLPRPSDTDNYRWKYMCDEYNPETDHTIPINDRIINISNNIKPVNNIEEEIASLKGKIDKLKNELKTINVNDRGYVNVSVLVPTIIPNQTEYTYQEKTQQIKDLESELNHLKELQKYLMQLNS